MGHFGFMSQYISSIFQFSSIFIQGFYYQICQLHKNTKMYIEKLQKKKLDIYNCQLGIGNLFRSNPILIVFYRD